MGVRARAPWKVWDDRPRLLARPARPVTGHTGFKGAWLSLWLHELGAEVVGLRAAAGHRARRCSMLAPVASTATRTIGDIRDAAARAARGRASAARDRVPPGRAGAGARALRRPVETFATNVMGTVHCSKRCATVDDFRRRGRSSPPTRSTGTRARALPYRGDDPLGGHDPYSASQGGGRDRHRELPRAFFAPSGVALATARAGNVIGGGDWAQDRLIPDLVRALRGGEPVALRNPERRGRGSTCWSRSAAT